MADIGIIEGDELNWNGGLITINTYHRTWDVARTTIAVVCGRRHTKVLSPRIDEVPPDVLVTRSAQKPARVARTVRTKLTIRRTRIETSRICIILVDLSAQT